MCIQIDNKTVVSYLSKGGGTRSLLLSRLARRILLWSQRISIQPVYVKGILNTLAHSLSRNKETQWHLSPAVTRTIFHKLGTPAVDLFASKLRWYMTLDKDTQALAVDALSQPWNFKSLYAFPPPPPPPPPPPVPVVSSGQQAEGVQLQDATGSTLLDGCSLFTYSDGAPVRHPSPSAAGAGSPDQHGDGLPSQQAGYTPSSSMAIMRQATGVDLQQTTFTLLECSWRGSTRKQYQSAWSTWEQWCASHSVGTTTVTVEKLLTYLQHLFSRGLAWISLNVHHSAISSILETHKPTPIGQHPLVCRFLKGVFNRRPPPMCPTPNVGHWTGFNAYC